ARREAWPRYYRKACPQCAFHGAHLRFARPVLRPGYLEIGCFNRCSHFLGECWYLVRANACGKSAERIVKAVAPRRGKVSKVLSDNPFFLSGAVVGRDALVLGVKYRRRTGKECVVQNSLATANFLRCGSAAE